MTPEQLKASILQYAIQGKLVEQRPEEGTAEELYQQIQTNLDAIFEVQTKKKNKNKILPIEEKDIPFDIPETWKWVRLGTIGYTNIGLTYSPKDQTMDGVIVLRSSNIQNGKMVYEDIVKVNMEIPDNKMCQIGDILICARNGSKRLVGKSAIVDKAGMSFGAFMAIFRSVCNQYIIHVINSAYFRNSLLGDTGTTTINQITQDMLKNSLVPLPPLAEQKRIVAKIEELLPLIDRYAASYEKLEQFNAMFPEDMKKSILQYAIQGKLVEQRPEEGTGEELYRQIQAEKQRLIQEKKIKKEKPLAEISEDEIPFDIPESWKWIKVGNVGSWSSGATPSRTNLAYYGGTIPWLKTGDLNDGLIKKIPEYITDLALEKTSVRLNPVGSVLMAMYGATIGKLGILDISATTNQACCACIPYEGIHNKYLFYYLMFMRRSYIGMAEGGAQPNISKEKIVNSLIPLPPLAEQKRIVAKIEELLPLCERLRK